MAERHLIIKTRNGVFATNSKVYKTIEEQIEEDKEKLSRDGYKVDVIYVGEVVKEKRQ